MKALAAAALVFVAAPASAEPVDAWDAFIAEAAARFRVPEIWILQVMRAESGGRTQLAGLPIRSRAGAMGLMQLMPRTWIAMRDAYRLGPDPDDPHDNILAGTAYLRMMYDRFGYPGLFAAYNAGPARYAAYLASGAPLPIETHSYVASVVAGTVVRQSRRNGVFFGGRVGNRLPSASPAPDPLFAIGGATRSISLTPDSMLSVAVHG